MDALWRWLPFLVTQGFLMNVLISFLTMAIGTLLGVLLGLGQISPIAGGQAQLPGPSPSCSATRPGWCCSSS